MTADMQNLNISAEDYMGHDQVRVGNGQGLYIHHIGSSILCSSNKDFFLKNILHVPSISQNLLSVHQFTKDNNVFFEFHPSFFCIKDLFSGATLLRGKSKDGLYPLQSIHQIKPHALIGERVSLAHWHARLDHPSLRIVRQVLSKHHLAISTNKSPPVCHACQLGKSHRLPFYLSPSRSQFPLDLIFTDVWGPSPHLSNNGNRYYVCFIDDYSKFIWLFPFCAKSDVFNIFLKFQKFVERYFDRKIKSLQSDWGGEYRNLNKFFTSLGISHRISCPHTHQQNGSVERKHRHIVETGLTLLASSSVPFSYWDEAFLTAAYLINCLPSPITQHKSPIDILYHKSPDYKFLKTFGCACWPHLRPYNSHKLDFRSKRCIFIGYSLNHKGYRCLNPTTNRIYIARNVIFDESLFPFASPSITSPTLHGLNSPHGSTNTQGTNTSSLIYIPHVQILSPPTPSSNIHLPRDPPTLTPHPAENTAFHLSENTIPHVQTSSPPTPSSSIDIPRDPPALTPLPAENTASHLSENTAHQSTIATPSHHTENPAAFANQSEISADQSTNSAATKSAAPHQSTKSAAPSHQPENYPHTSASLSSFNPNPPSIPTNMSLQDLDHATTLS